MENIMITSSREVKNKFHNELCKISLDDLNRLAYFTLSLKLSKEDNDISLSTTYCNALERYFRENNEDSNLREIYRNIKDDAIVKSLFIQNIELMIIRSNITDIKSFKNYNEVLERFVKSIKGNEIQKQNFDMSIDDFMSKTR